MPKFVVTDDIHCELLLQGSYFRFFRVWDYYCYLGLNNNVYLSKSASENWKKWHFLSKEPHQYVTLSIKREIFLENT